MVKSILLRDGDGRFVMACVLGHARLDSRAVRAGSEVPLEDSFQDLGPV